MARSRLHQRLLPVTAFLSIGLARADEGLIQYLNNNFEGAVGVEHLSYSEMNDGISSQLPANSDLDTESGTIAATAFSANWQGRAGSLDRIRAGVDLQVATGNAVYNGYLQDFQSGALTPLQSTTNETFVDVHMRIGRGFELMGSKRDLITLYAAFGFTSWNRELTGAGGYTEQYQHLRWRLGGQYQITLAPRLVASMDAGFGKTFSASLTSSDLPNTFDLGGSWNQSYEMGLRYLASPRVYLGLDAFWTHYGYGRSPAYAVDINGQAGIVMEPDSKTVRNGVRAVIGYSYR